MTPDQIAAYRARARRATSAAAIARERHRFASEDATAAVIAEATALLPSTIAHHSDTPSLQARRRMALDRDTLAFAPTWARMTGRAS